MESYLALIHAGLCRDGVERMRADAGVARDGLAPESPLLGPALLFEGVAHLLAGEEDRADAILDQAVEMAIHDRALPAAATALAERALLAIRRQDWSQAETLAGRALEIVRTGRLDDYPDAALVHSVVARIALRQGDVPRAKEQLARAARLRPLLTYAIPWGAVQMLVEMGHAYLALDDGSGAKAVLQQSRDILSQRPDLGVLSRQTEELGSKVGRIRGRAVGVSSLTTAELRLLPLLSTHLTMREIGERLYLSPHTVRSQAGSIYRKLGATSRSQAIERTQQIGLGV